MPHHPDSKAGQPSAARRRLFKAAGAAGAAAVIPLRAIPAEPAPQAYAFFSADEAAFVEAAVARLIPADELGPGALEAGVPQFIDRQLAGPWGRGARLYRSGPWREGTPSQGYQQPFTPAELFRAELREIEVRRFAGLGAEEQDAFLRELQKARGDFFEMLLSLTVQGFFADPIHGGNRGMVGWKLVGFPGAYANYHDLVGVNAPFQAPPVGIETHAGIEPHAGPHGVTKR